jgi:hypothetical protein
MNKIALNPLCMGVTVSKLWACGGALPSRRRETWASAELPDSTGAQVSTSAEMPQGVAGRLSPSLDDEFSPTRDLCPSLTLARGRVPTLARALFSSIGTHHLLSVRHMKEMN